ncbi:hypothetical protein Tco_0572979 [Tanacetum coccineum]
MANLEFYNKHSMVAYLEKSEGSEGFHEIIDFLDGSHIKYALTMNPTIYVSFIKQFWRTATASTDADGQVEITTTIDGHVKTITETSLRRHLKLEENDGVTSLPNTEIFEQLALMGYETDSDKLTFQKGNFSPQWRFLIHTILYYLSPKKTDWEQFNSNIATAIICLATNRTYNFSKMIFDAMVKNVDSLHKFSMYPRFVQICLDMQKKHLQSHTRTYDAHSLTNKVFSNMKRVSKGYSGIEVPLFYSMLTAAETSPSRITFSPSISSEPSLSPQHSPTSAPSTSQPQTTYSIPTTEEAIPTPHESPLHSVHLLGRDEGSLSLHELTALYTTLLKRVEGLESDLKQTKETYNAALTKLIKKVKKLKQIVKTSKSKRRSMFVLPDDEEAPEDSSKQGRKISNIDEDPNISLVQDKGVTLFQDAEIQEKASDYTELVLEEQEPTELMEDQGNGEKGKKEVTTPINVQTYIKQRRIISTGSGGVSTASRQDDTADVSTASEIGSTAAKKAKDKGKAIMTEPEPEKKTKLKERHERAGLEAAIRLQEQLEEEEKQRLARDA